MANLIQIKRSLNTANATGLANGELAYTANGDVLFIGSNSSIVAIAGARTPGTLTANQALVANSTSGIDKVIVANLVPTSIYANGAAGTGGQLLSSNSTGGVYWSTPSAGVAGSDTQVQFNDGGALAGEAGLTYNKTTDTLTVAGSVLAGATVNAAALTVGTSIVANTTRLAIGTSVGLLANGGLGTAGQVLHSNGTSVYWATDDGSVTSITAANGLSGGTITTTGTIAVTGGSTLTVNTTGVHVNTANLSIATSQLTGDVALGTNTSGNYVATITAGNGISGSSTTEGGTPTIAVVAGTNGGLVSNTTGVWVSAGSGLVSNATGLHVGSANGINVQADTVGLTTGSTLTVNTTGAHVNTTLSLTSMSTSGDVQIGGNLIILGDLLTINVATLAVEDSLIQLASNNTTSDLVDIGFFGSYEAGDAGTHEHTGFFRDASDSGIYKLFVNLEEAPTATVNTTGVGYTTGTLEAFLKSGALISNSTTVTVTANSTVNVNITANSLTLSTPLAVTSGGIGRSSITPGAILVGNNSGATTVLAAAADGYVLQSNGTSVVYGTLDGGTF